MEQAVYLEATLADRLQGVKKQAQITGGSPNLTTIAECAGINRATVSQIANGQRIPTPAQESKLWSALKELGLTDADDHAIEVAEQTTKPESMRTFQPICYKRTIELYETRQYRDAMGWCEYIRANRKMGIMIGHPGSGKTTVLKQFVAQIPGARYIECWSTMRMGDLLGELALAAGVALSGNVYQRTKQVMRGLQGRTDVVLVFDEAEQLRKWDVDKFETLRKIWDNTGTPVILAGTGLLRNLLTRGGGRENLAQLYRRKYEFELTGIADKEVRAILREYNLTTEAAAELTRIATDARHGGMGNFVELLGLCLNAANGERIDGSMLAGAKQYKLMY